MAIKVTSEVLEALREAAKRADPCEACGLLLGEAVQITRFVEASNVHASPETHFEIDPQALIDAHRAARMGGPKLLGYFHSHPKGPAKPSQTDQDMASGDEMIWAIAGESEIAFWHDLPEGFRPLSYAMVDGQN
ncbi:MAG: M67 family metallopeptidase [Erythrobacter sp.]|uniref:M67 family metallopeptidase n=1 Tax=Erythrobacter sp. TaxID=1042 RepID=UPI0032633060